MQFHPFLSLASCFQKSRNVAVGVQVESGRTGGRSLRPRRENSTDAVTLHKKLA
uniref:Uncharacterized protein n=1 Tax=Romanomermis culicivorax TaxID=13658 RepID=A0A915KKW8_ROMCU